MIRTELTVPALRASRKGERGVNFGCGKKSWCGSNPIETTPRTTIATSHISGTQLQLVILAYV